VDDLPDAPLEVHVWPGADAAFVLYEDAGDGYAYETGESATTELAWDDAGRRLVIGERTGAYAGMPAERELVVVVHGEGAGDADALPGAAARVTCRGERLVVTA
jgi:alpha-D-xyloside xylohydrolase